MHVKFNAMKLASLNKSLGQYLIMGISVNNTFVQIPDFFNAGKRNCYPLVTALFSTFNWLVLYKDTAGIAKPWHLFFLCFSIT